MKEIKLLLATLVSALTMTIGITSCKGSDNGEPDINKPVVVDDKNKASDGSSIISIDDYNFYKDYIKYSVEAGHLIVSGYDNAGFKGAAKIDSQITYKDNSYEVLEIGNKAFYECNSLTSITLPKGITSIGDYAFSGCSSLTSINIPEDLKRIGKSAFSGCNSIASEIRIPEGVKKIDEFTFSGCKAIKSITLPSGLESIYSYSFRNCSNLESITIPDNVETIGNSAFEGCSSLTSIRIGKSIKYIGENAFSNCTSLNEVYCNAALPESPQYVQIFKGSNLDATLYVPGEYAQDYLDDDKWKMFVVIVGRDTYFKDFNEYRDVTYSPEHFIYEGFKCHIISYKDKIVSLYADHSLLDNEAHENLIIPESIYHYDGTKYSCVSVWAIGMEKIKTIYLPNSITEIGLSAFMNCTNLASINIPESVTSIGNSAFRNCTSLTTITIPSKVTSIGGYGVFQECINLSEITFLNPNPITLWKESFLNTYFKTIYVPSGSVDAYKSADVWKEYAGIIKPIP